MRLAKSERGIDYPIAIDNDYALLDGEAHGLDIDEDGNGLLRAGRLHQLVRQAPEVRKRTLEITFLEPGAEAYVLTFG